jgi:WD40 repeat protein
MSNRKVIWLVLTLALVGGSAALADADGRQRDRNGDPLPPGAIARIGSLRFRTRGQERLYWGLSPDGHTLVTGEVGRIRFWDISTGRELRSAPITDHGLFYFSFAPNGRYVLVAIDNSILWTNSGYQRIDVVLYVLEVATGRVVKRLQPAGRQLPGQAPGAVSSDGKLLFLTDWMDRDGGLQVIDVATGAILRRMAGPRSGLTPDGANVIAWDQPQRLRFIDTANGRVRQTTAYDGGSPYQIAFSADGKTFAARHLPPEGPVDGPMKTLIRIWDIGGGRVKTVIPYDGPAYTTLTLSADGGLLVLWPDQQHDPSPELRVWESATGRLIFQTTLPTLPLSIQAPFSYPIFSRDGKVMYWKESPKVIGHWETVPGQPPRRLQSPATVDDLIALTPDGKNVLLSSSQNIVVCDAATGRPRSPGSGHTQALRQLLFTSDGKLLASLDRLGSLRLWEVANGTPRRFGTDEEVAHVVQIRITPDGRLLVAWGLNPPSRGGTWFLRGWKLAPAAAAEPVWERTVGSGASSVLAPDGCSAALVNEEEPGNLILLDTKTGAEAGRVKAHTGPIGEYAYQAAGRLLVTHGADEFLCVWDSATGKRRRQLSWPRRKSGGISISDDATKLTILQDSGRLELWDFVADRVLWMHAGSRGEFVGPLAFSANGRHLAGFHGMPQGIQAAVWDSATGKETTGPVDAGDVVGDQLLRGPGGEVLARTRQRQPKEPTAVEDVLRALPSGRVAGRVPGKAGAPPGRRSPAGGRPVFWQAENEGVIIGRQTLAAPMGDTATCWDTTSGRELLRLPRAHDNGVTALALAPNGGILATGGGEGIILLWDLNGLMAKEPRK